MTFSRETITERLARSADRNARAIAAGFHWIPIEMIEQFAADKNSIVRLCAAKNPEIPTPLLKRLTNDIAPHVREAAFAALGLRENPPKSPASNFERFAPKTPFTYGLLEPQVTLLEESRDSRTTPNRLEELLDVGSEWVRANIAYPNFSFGSRLTDPESNRLTAVLVEMLASDESGLVRAALARNPFTPTDTLRAFLFDPDHRVGLMLSSNPSAPIDLLQEIAENGRLDCMEAIARNVALTRQ